MKLWKMVKVRLLRGREEAKTTPFETHQSATGDRNQSFSGGYSSCFDFLGRCANETLVLFSIALPPEFRTYVVQRVLV